MLLALVPSGQPIVIFIDETLERRRGAKIKAKGYYRDAVRSSKSQVVKTSGLKWLVMALSIRMPFLPRALALPFLSVLEYSKKCDEQLFDSPFELTKKHTSAEENSTTSDS